MSSDNSTGPATTPKPAKVKKPARPAKARKRHVALFITLILIVVIPCAVVYSYLYTRAHDQYASMVGFSIRSEEVPSAVELFGGISSISSGSNSDSEILYEFVQSQKIVRTIDEVLDLRALFSKPDNDPYFSFDPDGSIEDLTRHWQRMVSVDHDSGSGLLELRVLAFTAADAQSIAEEIVRQCSIKINQLSAIARDDATGYARVELDKAVDRLKSAREAVISFRNTYQIVDPTLESQSKLGVLSSLQQQLTETYVELDLLASVSGKNDPRIRQANRKIKVIEERIASERQKIGLDSEGTDQGFSSILGEFERLSVDLEFAQQTYLTALTSYDNAQAKAQRQSRYLAAYIEPTLAETAEYPSRISILALVSLFLFLTWSLIILIYYSIRDRR